MSNYEDRIEIKGLKVFAHHGVYDFEKENGQDFYIDVILYTNTRNAGISDKLEESVDYGNVCFFISNFMKNNRFDLIEAVAEEMAETILLKYDLINKARVTVHKPNAPIELEFEDVSISIERKWHDVVLSIGSNMGNTKEYLANAIKALENSPKIRHFQCSKLIETKPYGGVEQDNFLNGCIKLQTLFTPQELLDFAHKIESDNDRERIVHWGPRTLDVDIVFYDDLVLNTPDLVIPHPDMENRDFVLRPLMELAPEYMHPVLQKPVKVLFKELQA